MTSTCHEARQFFGRLYDREKVCSLDALRQHLFAQTKSDLPKLSILQRMPFFSMFWELCTSWDYGCMPVNAIYFYPWWLILEDASQMTNFPQSWSFYLTPEELELSSFCKCKTSRCITKMCSCVRAGVSCSVACNCNFSSSGCDCQISEDTYSGSENENKDED